MTKRSVEPTDSHYVMALDHVKSIIARSEMHSEDLPLPPSDSDDAAPPGLRSRVLNNRAHRHVEGATVNIDEEILTYDEAAQLLKISARTLERWTREGLVPYIRLPQRGRWSGVRFSRNQLLRWLRQRTVRAR